jgi:epoxide hydrolase-like predicted phosphatase
MTPNGSAPPRIRALITDWGGVLTTPLWDSLDPWLVDLRLSKDEYARVMRRLAGPEAAAEALVAPVHALERGEMTVPDFERRLADELTAVTGRPFVADGLLRRMFAAFQAAPDMIDVVRRAKAAGVRTALLSNSWGNDYPRDGWATLFDAVVISGEVGMRKPEPRIYTHTLDLVGCAAAEAVFVDDLPSNVRAAVELGMVGVRHVSYEQTVLELESVLDVPLR